MNQASRSIGILSLGQILALGREKIGDTAAIETLERHVRQVAAIILEKPWNKVDGQSETLLSQVEALIAEGAKEEIREAV